MNLPKSTIGQFQINFFSIYTDGKEEDEDEPGNDRKIHFNLSKREGTYTKTSMEFILIPCLLVLLCTGYWRGFLKVFVYIIKRDHCTAEMIKDSANALKLVCSTSFIWGSIGFTISLVNLMRHHMPEPEFAALCGDISVALLPLLYSLVMNAVLMPLYFELNRLHAKKAE